MTTKIAKFNYWLLRGPSTLYQGAALPLDPVAVMKIVMAHLSELPDYYTRLEKMEGGE